jgi:hypothetical protein
MTSKFTVQFLLVSIVLLASSLPAYSQNCTGKSKIRITKTDPLADKAKPLLDSTASQQVKIRVPENYRPPIANEKLITFPGTLATKHKQKKLLNRRKRTKKKGCLAANM